MQKKYAKVVKLVDIFKDPMLDTKGFVGKVGVIHNLDKDSYIMSGADWIFYEEELEFLTKEQYEIHQKLINLG